MIDILRNGSIELIGRHPYASNAAYLVECDFNGERCRAIYKPVSGERELWDFPGVELAAREVAAYAVSEALGLALIPETVWREDAPAGPGSLQRWIEDASISDIAVVTDFDESWLPVLDAQLADGTDVTVAHRDTAELRALAFLDVVLNNADRKGGHILRDSAGKLWAVDHGVTFHQEPKLRTVLWGFTGQAISSDLLQRLDRELASVPSVRLALDEPEIAALHSRTATLQETGVYPAPSPNWPSVPWPVF